MPGTWDPSLNNRFDVPLPIFLAGRGAGAWNPLIRISDSGSCPYLTGIRRSGALSDRLRAWAGRAGSALRVAVMRAGRTEPVDTPDALYAEPANAFVHEFLGEAIRLDCTVSEGVAQFPGLPAAGVPTDCPAGPAIAVIRPYQIGLVPGLSPAVVQSVHAHGPLQWVRVLVGGHGLEVLLPAEGRTPPMGESCGLDLGRARVYPG